MNQPHRIQRTRAFRDTPAGTVYVGRGSRWANPFRSDRFGHARATGLHRAWLKGTLSPRGVMMLGFNAFEAAALARLRNQMLPAIKLLAGYNLICWCSRNSRWCHADTLIVIANEHAPFEGLAA